MAERFVCPSMVNTESLSVTERLVLLSIADAERNGETPIESLALKQRTREIADMSGTTVVGEVSEREVMRALNSLGAEPYLEEIRSDTSVSGKGRPKYALDAAPETVFEKLGADDQLAEAVERFS